MNPAYHPRELEDAIQLASQGFPVLLLTGPRQSGKTTLLRHLAGQDRAYVTLDDPAVRGLAREDPRLFLERYRAPALVDEIQYAPELLPYIKMAVDESRSPGAYWLTGSQQFPLMQGITETLAGRVAIVNLLGFSHRERTRSDLRVEPFLPDRERLRNRPEGSPPGAKSVFEQIWAGSFPGLVASVAVDREVFYGSYLQTYLERDVRELSQVGDLDTFATFVRACAARSGQLLNLANLSRDVDIEPRTAKRWLSILRASFQIHLLPPYHNNLTKRLVKTPKLYFLDTGLMAHLTGWLTPESLAAGAMAGAAFETFVVSEIVKSWWHRGKQPPIYFYRDRDMREVNILFDVDGRLYPVEIKASATAKRSWIGAFTPIAGLGRPVGDGAVICLAGESLPLRRDLSVIPPGMI